MMFDEIMHVAGEPGDPIGLLLMAAAVRDEMPWLYEIAVEGYHAIKAGDASAGESEINRLGRVRDIVMHGPMREELGYGGKEAHMLLMELPHMMEHMMRRCLESKKPTARRRRAAKPVGD